MSMMMKLKQILRLSEEIKRINTTLTTPVRSPTRRVSEYKRNMSSNFESPDRSSSSPFGIIKQEGVRKNLSIYFGHENWNLVLNMMIGIRKAIKTLHPLNDDIEVSNTHF